MMNFSPFFRFPPFRRPYPYYYPLHNEDVSSMNFSKTPPFPNTVEKRKTETVEPSEECFDFFGLKLHFDDLLIIALLFFLYQEEVKDPYLYIALILLLLS